MDGAGSVQVELGHTLFCQVLLVNRACEFKLSASSAEGLRGNSDLFVPTGIACTPSQLRVCAEDWNS